MPSPAQLCEMWNGILMNLLKVAAEFVVTVLTVAALTVLGLAIGGPIAAYALLFLLLVGVGMWVHWKLSHRPPTSHVG